MPIPHVPEVKGSDLATSASELKIQGKRRGNTSSMSRLVEILY